MTQWMQHLLWQSLAMSAIVLAYYAATIWLKRRYAARWFYLVGMMLLIGFLIPYRPTLTVEMEKAPEIIQGMVSQGALAQPPVQGPFSGTHAAKQSFSWPILFIVWAVGALGVLLYHGIKHMRFVHTVKRWCTKVEDAGLLSQFEEAKQALRLDGRAIGLAFCECISSPMLLWLGKPMVLLPNHAPVAYDSQLILLHELVHYKRRDLLCRLVMLLSTAIHWFNPAIYLLVKLVILQCEVSCDDKVVENQDIEGRHQYAMTIIGAAHCHSKGYTLLTTYFYGGKDTMKKRISSIYEPAKTKLGALLLACMLLMTMLAGTSIAADTADALNYTLPSEPIKFAQDLDSYKVTWEPMEGIKEYNIGMYYKTEGAESGEFWVVAGGWVGDGVVEDSNGVQYTVENGAWDSIKLPGNATEVELSELINRHSKPISILNDKYEVTGEEEVVALHGFNLIIVAVREAGEPIYMDIEIPVA